jgi:putative copper export protein
VALFIHIIPEWFELIFLTLCIGTLLCRLWVLALSPGTGVPYQEISLNRMWLLFGIGIAAITISSIANLFIGASDMSGQPIPMVFPLLPTVIFRTHSGRVWLIRMATLVVLSAALITGRRYRSSHRFLLLMLGFTVIISMTESASGHASDKGDFSLAEIVDWLHLLAASFWGGGLLVLSSAIVPALLRTADQSAMPMAGVARRFSRIAGCAVGIIAVTSLYNAWSYVGSFEALWKMPYGRTVLAKIILFLVLMNLGAFNRYMNVPLLQQWAGMSPGSQGVVNRIAVQFFSRFFRSQNGYQIALRFKKSVRIEAFLIVGVLLCAALLRHEIPARHISHMEHHGERGHLVPHDGGDAAHTHSDDHTH